MIYADPPYLKSTQKAPGRYRHDYEEHDHVRLLELLRKAPRAVMNFSYPSAQYDELLDQWRSVEVRALNQAGVVTE